MERGEANDTLAACYQRTISPVVGMGETMDALLWDREGKISKAPEKLNNYRESPEI
jgi:hypothetical protein